jgi:hypothetical protein
MCFVDANALLGGKHGCTGWAGHRCDPAGVELPMGTSYLRISPFLAAPGHGLLLSAGILPRGGRLPGVVEAPRVAFTPPPSPGRASLASA